MARHYKEVNLALTVKEQLTTRSRVKGCFATHVVWTPRKGELCKPKITRSIYVSVVKVNQFYVYNLKSVFRFAYLNMHYQTANILKLHIVRDLEFRLLIFLVKSVTMGWSFQRNFLCTGVRSTTITFKRNEATVQMDGLCFPLKERAEG